MVRKIITSLTFAAVLGTSISAVAPASAQTIADTGASKPVFAPATSGGSVSKASSLTTPPEPDAVKAGVALRESLTSEQLASLNAVFASHEAELLSIAQSLNAPRAGSLSGQNPNSALAGSTPEALSQETLASLQAGTEQLRRVNSDIEQELADVLSASQMDLFRAGMATDLATLDGIAPAAEGIAKQDNQLNATDCNNAAKYEAYALYYAYYEYIFSYYNYMIRSTDQAWNAYYYAYYGYPATRSAVQYIGGAAYSIATWGSDFTNGGAKGVDLSYEGYYDSYFVYINADTDYTNSKSDNKGNGYYAQYAAAYGYYAYAYGNTAHTYAASGCK